MKRRTFLQSMVNVSLGSLLYSPYLSATESNSKLNRFLVVIELQGGNDGLNTVIPVNQSLYYKLRPQLSIPKAESLSINRDLALHPSLTNLRELYENSEMSIVHSVGYQSSNRSHFASRDVWNSGSEDTNHLRSDGWMTRIPIDETKWMTPAIVFGPNNHPVTGNGWASLKLNSIQEFVRGAKSLPPEKVLNGNELVGANTLQAIRAANQLKDLLDIQFEDHLFPNTKFGKGLQQAAQVIINGSVAPLIKVALKGFDTHANQRGSHDELLAELDLGLHTFISILKAHDLWSQVVIMTTSEFGRRAHENGNNGTDHGAAAPHFILGASQKKPIYGETPNLKKLVRGDVPYQMHLREYYALATGYFLSTQEP